MTSKPLAVMRSPMRLQVAARWVLAASLVWMLSAVQVMAATLSLDDTLRVHDAWPHVRVLSDPERRIAADEALQRLPEFKPPASPHAGMGFRNDALWFHLPVAVPADSDGRWVLEIDYALLNRVEVFVARAGRTEHAATMGSLLPFVTAGTPA